MWIVINYPYRVKKRTNVYPIIYSEVYILLTSHILGTFAFSTFKPLIAWYNVDKSLLLVLSCRIFCNLFTSIVPCSVLPLLSANVLSRRRNNAETKYKIK